jgi:transglutaminase-like putative cysteine protease
VTVRDETPIAEAFEKGQLADHVQMGPGGRSVVLYDLTLVEDDGPGACGVVVHGRPAPTTIRGEIQVKKILHMDRVPARRAWLVLCVWPAAGERAPLQVTLNGRALTCRKGRRGDDWPALRIPTALLREGDNEVVLSCRPTGRRVGASRSRNGQHMGWQIPVAQREDILRNDPSRSDRLDRSFRSTDGGSTWTAELGDDGRQSGEFMVRLHLEQYAARGELIGPVVDLTPRAASGSDVPSEVRVKSVRVRGTKRARPGTGVAFFLRSGETPEYHAGRWSDWQPCGRSGVVRGELARFVQWRAVLTTTRPTLTPALEAVEVEAEIEPLGDPEGSPRGPEGPRPQQWAAGLRLADSHNEEIRYTSIPFEYERFDEPQLVALRKLFRLDEVVAGAKTELQKMIRLRNWVSAQWKYDPPLPHYPAWDAQEILQLRQGICVQYAIVYLQCALSLGMQTRFVFGYFPNVTAKGEGVCGHEVTEYWSNESGKWVMMDPHLDECFVDRRTGLPASMLELHEDQLNTYFPDGIDYAAPRAAGPQAPAGDIGRGGSFDDLLPSKGLLLWKGAETAPRPEEPKLDIKWGYLHWMPRNNFYNHRFPEPLCQGLGWDWTGYRLWQDARTPRQWRFGSYTGRRSDIEWTLNQVRWALTATERAGTIRVAMTTVTPDFDTFLVSVDGEDWRPSPDTFAWRLHAGRNRLEMRVRNRAGVLGRVSWAEIVYACSVLRRDGGNRTTATTAPKEQHVAAHA